MFLNVLTMQNIQDLIDHATFFCFSRTVRPNLAQILQVKSHRYLDIFGWFPFKCLKIQVIAINYFVMLYLWKKNDITFNSSYSWVLLGQNKGPGWAMPKMTINVFFVKWYKGIISFQILFISSKSCKSWLNYEWFSCLSYQFLPKERPPNCPLLRFMFLVLNPFLFFF